MAGKRYFDATTIGTAGRGRLIVQETTPHRPGGWRRAAGAAGVAGVVCALLLASILDQRPPEAVPANPAAQPAGTAVVRTNPYWVYTEDVVIERVNPYWTYVEDVVINGNPAAPAPRPDASR